MSNSVLSKPRVPYKQLQTAKSRPKAKIKALRGFFSTHKDSSFGSNRWSSLSALLIMDGLLKFRLLIREGEQNCNAKNMRQCRCSPTFCTRNPVFSHILCSVDISSVLSHKLSISQGRSPQFYIFKIIIARHMIEIFCWFLHFPKLSVVFCNVAAASLKLMPSNGT